MTKTVEIALEPPTAVSTAEQESAIGRRNIHLVGERWGLAESGSRLNYGLDREIGLGAVTAQGGVPALIERFRSSGAAAALPS